MERQFQLELGQQQSEPLERELELRPQILGTQHQYMEQLAPEGHQLALVRVGGRQIQLGMGKGRLGLQLGKARPAQRQPGIRHRDSGLSQLELVQLRR